MLKGPREQEKSLRALLSASIRLTREEEIEHKWKRFIVYASSNHPSHPRSHKASWRDNINEWDAISRSASRASSSPKKERRKAEDDEVEKLNNVKLLLWIALAPEGDWKWISRAIHFDALDGNWTWFHYVIASFVKVKGKMHQNRNLWIALTKQTKEMSEWDRVRRDTPKRAPRTWYLTLWESDGCFTIIIWNGKWVHTAEICRTSREESGKVINYSARKQRHFDWGWFGWSVKWEGQNKNLKSAKWMTASLRLIFQTNYS